MLICLGLEIGVITFDEFIANPPIHTYLDVILTIELSAVSIMARSWWSGEHATSTH